MLKEILELTEVIKVGSITHKGEKHELAFKFNFEGMSVEQVCAIAAKDLVTDIQNTTRTNGGDSPERGEAKATRRKDMIEEQTEKGFVDIRANAKVRIQAIAVRPMTNEEAMAAVLNNPDFAEKMRAILAENDAVKNGN